MIALPPSATNGAPTAAESARQANRLRRFWTALCIAWIVPVFVVAIWILETAASSFGWWSPDSSGLGALIAFVATVTTAVAVGGLGPRRGWNRLPILRVGWSLVGVAWVVVTLALLNARMASAGPRTIDKVVLNNARVLAAASSQYFLEHQATTCAFSDLVGPGKTLNTIHTIAGETYPRFFTEGAALTIHGVAGARTITYAP